MKQNIAEQPEDPSDGSALSPRTQEWAPPTWQFCSITNKRAFLASPLRALEPVLPSCDTSSSVLLDGRTRLSHDWLFAT